MSEGTLYLGEDWKFYRLRPIRSQERLRAEQYASKPGGGTAPGDAHQTSADIGGAGATPAGAAVAKGGAAPAPRTPKLEGVGLPSPKLTPTSTGGKGPKVLPAVQLGASLQPPALLPQNISGPQGPKQGFFPPQEESVAHPQTGENIHHSEPGFTGALHGHMRGRLGASLTGMQAQVNQLTQPENPEWGELDNQQGRVDLLRDTQDAIAGHVDEFAARALHGVHARALAAGKNHYHDLSLTPIQREREEIMEGLRERLGQPQAAVGAVEQDVAAAGKQPELSRDQKAYKDMLTGVDITEPGGTMMTKEKLALRRAGLTKPTPGIAKDFLGENPEARLPPGRYRDVPAGHQFLNQQRNAATWALNKMRKAVENFEGMHRGAPTDAELRASLIPLQVQMPAGKTEEMLKRAKIGGAIRLPPQPMQDFHSQPQVGRPVYLSGPGGVEHVASIKSVKDDGQNYHILLNLNHPEGKKGEARPEHMRDEQDAYRAGYEGVEPPHSLDLSNHHIPGHHRIYEQTNKADYHPVGAHYALGRMDREAQAPYGHSAPAMQRPYNDERDFHKTADALNEHIKAAGHDNATASLLSEEYGRAFEDHWTQTLYNHPELYHDPKAAQQARGDLHQRIGQMMVNPSMRVKDLVAEYGEGKEVPEALKRQVAHEERLEKAKETEDILWNPDPENPGDSEKMNERLLLAAGRLAKDPHDDQVAQAYGQSQGDMQVVRELARRIKSGAIPASMVPTEGKLYKEGLSEGNYATMGGGDDEEPLEIAPDEEGQEHPFEEPALSAVPKGWEGTGEGQEADYNQGRREYLIGDSKLLAPGEKPKKAELNHSENARNLIDSMEAQFSQDIGNTAHLDAKGKEQWHALVSNPLGRMSERALYAVRQNVSNLHIHRGAPELFKKLLEDQPTPVMEKWVEENAGKIIGGVYSGLSRAIHIPSFWSSQGHQIMAHEMGHAIDRMASGHMGKYSQTPAWKAAWNEEFKNKQKLSVYSETNEKEGFAEGIGALLSGTVSHKKMWEDVPMTMQFFEDNGLLHDEHKRPKEAEQHAKPGDGRLMDDIFKHDPGATPAPDGMCVDFMADEA